MDYEKLYTEALERARTGKPIDEVFPELKESEDEKIRKALLRCCDDWEKGQFGCMAKEDIPAIRAYLEKQKEQKIAEKVYPEKLEDAIKLYYDTYGNGKLGFDNLSYLKFKDIVETFVEEYGQNSAEWSEEDVDMFGSIVSTLSLNIQTDTRCKEIHEKELKWFNELYQRGLQPSHWKPSEEQMDALLEASSSFLNETLENSTLLLSLYNDLNKL